MAAHMEGGRRMNVAFINENTLGHASYLVPYVQWFERHPKTGITPHLINATPLPPRLRREADFTVPGLRRFGLDFHNARWRLTVSQHARALLDALQRTRRIDAVVVNTQSVALDLVDIAREMPLFVCLDATFAQLSRSGWFAPNLPSKLFLPLTSAQIRHREHELFKAATALVPWSEQAEFSLVEDCGVSTKRIHRLPPSVEPPKHPRARKRSHKVPQVLFMGGDFRRKGGELLLEAYRNHLAGACELHIVTASNVAPEEGVIVYRGVKAGSDAWQERWEQADLLVFPSTLETFGIVLVEALSFEVPVVATRVGAAAEVLADGDAGWLIEEATPTAVSNAIREIIAQPGEASLCARRGRLLVEQRYHLDTNARRLAGWLMEAAK